MEEWISATYHVQRCVVFFCLRSEEQISVFNHFSLTFSLQYSVISICSRFDEKVLLFFFRTISFHNLLQFGGTILSCVIHVPSAVEPVFVGYILFVII